MGCERLNGVMKRPSHIMINVRNPLATRSSLSLQDVWLQSLKGNYFIEVFSSVAFYLFVAFYFYLYILLSFHWLWILKCFLGVTQTALLRSPLLNFATSHVFKAAFSSSKSGTLVMVELCLISCWVVMGDTI